MENKFPWFCLAGSAILYVAYMVTGNISDLIISLWGLMFGYLFYKLDKIEQEVNKKWKSKKKS